MALWEVQMPQSASAGPGSSGCAAGQGPCTQPGPYTDPFGNGSIQQGREVPLFFAGWQPCGAGPLPGNRLQPGESCPEQMAASACRLPLLLMDMVPCLWLHSALWGAVLLQCWVLRVFPLFPGAQARWTHGQEVPR